MRLAQNRDKNLSGFDLLIFYNCRDTMRLNNVPFGLSEKTVRNIRHLKGFNGCAGNRALAEKALAENMDIVDEISALEESIVYVIFSSAGGTGSGVSTALIDMLVEETDKTICAIVVLPDKDEDFDFHVNSYKCCQELLEIENMGSVMFLDNNSGNKQTINSICTTMLNTFLSNNSVSELGNVDEQEKRTILSTHGSMVLSVLGNEKASAENTIADRGDIDYEAVNKLVDIIPIMQKLDSKDVAKAIVKEFHNDDKGLSYDVSKQPKKSNKGRKPKTEFTVEKGEKTE